MARASSPTFELWLTTKAKGGRAGRGPRRRGVPHPPRCIQAVRVSQATLPYLKPLPSPGGSPKPLPHQGNRPCRPHHRPEEKG
jgi:hypothetical protein